MNIVAIAYEHLIDRFIRWAQTEDNIRAAVVIGLRARVDHPADEWSDLDLIILADDPEPYWATTDRIRVSEHTVWTAKKLRRGELWTAKSCCDSYIKQLLRRMLEWHTRARRGASVDTWMRGRFLEEWADACAVVALPAIFAHYDEADVWRALLATMELFRWLALETAEGLGYAYPSLDEDRAVEIVDHLHANAHTNEDDTGLPD